MVKIENQNNITCCFNISNSALHRRESPQLFLSQLLLQDLYGMISLVSIIGSTYLLYWKQETCLNLFLNGCKL